MQTFQQQLPGLVGEIADYLRRRVYLSCESFITGAAIAVMSSFAAARYRVGVPTIESIECDDRPHTVHQSVLLVGSSGSGKGCAIGAVSSLFMEVGDESYVNGFISKEALWQRGAKHPGTLWAMEHENHLSLIQRDPTSIKRANRAISSTLTALQESARNEVATRPFITHSAHNAAYIPSSPITILSESTDRAFQTKLPEKFSESHYFGKLLMVHAEQPPISNIGNETIAPSPELVFKLRQLSELRCSGKIVNVYWTSDALNLMRVFILKMEIIKVRTNIEGLPPPTPDLSLLNTPALNIAALLAIGNNHMRPVITVDILAVALEIADGSYDIMRTGLDVEPLSWKGH